MALNKYFQGKNYFSCCFAFFKVRWYIYIYSNQIEESYSSYIDYVLILLLYYELETGIKVISVVLILVVLELDCCTFKHINESC